MAKIQKISNLQKAINGQNKSKNFTPLVKNYVLTQLNEALQAQLDCNLIYENKLKNLSKFYGFGKRREDKIDQAYTKVSEVSDQNHEQAEKLKHYIENFQTEPITKERQTRRPRYRSPF